MCPDVSMGEEKKQSGQLQETSFPPAFIDNEHVISLISCIVREPKSHWDFWGQLPAGVEAGSVWQWVEGALKSSEADSKGVVKLVLTSLRMYQRQHWHSQSPEFFRLKVAA